MKVLFVGLGGIGQRHLRNLVKLKGDSVRIYAYRVRREGFVLNNRLEITDNDLEERYHIHVVESLEEAFHTGMDCVFICNPSSMHMEILLEAVRHGCHVFVEKPLSHTYECVDELERLLLEKPVTTFVGYQNRFHPCIIKAGQLLKDKAVGRVIMVDAEIGESVKLWHTYEDYRRMYACRSELGGGVVLSQIHELDYLISFFGMPESIYAVGGKLSDLEADVEDVASIIMKYRLEGKTVPVTVREDYLQNPPTRRCKILGTEGRIEFDLLSSRLWVYDGTGGLSLEETYEFERNDMFLEEMQIFLDETEGKRGPEGIPVSEGLKSLKVALLAKRSLETGSVMQVL
ncbi:MAG: Gfo/Idh/MocA family oxidoreductase [Lachnospiraceae bacterium]|nr:Gfo/Idh/MocA family oxidoreductase [Lachnospiraceae bacterium]